MDITRFTSKKFLIPGTIILVILIALAILPLYGSLCMVILITAILMYTILTVSWALFFSPTGYMSLATAAFFGVGIYASAILLPDTGQLLPLPVVIIIGSIGIAIHSCFSRF